MLTAKLFTSLQRRVPRFKVWALIAVLTAIGLFGYFVALGASYWQTSKQVVSLNSQTYDLSLKMKSGAPIEAVPGPELESAERRLADLKKAFDSGESQTAMAALHDAAAESNVRLLSVVIGKLVPTVQEDVQYQNQPITVSIQGKAANISQFLTSIRNGMPAVALSDLRMTNMSSYPSAQVQLVLYTSPEPVPTKTGIASAAPPKSE